MYYNKLPAQIIFFICLIYHPFAIHPAVEKARKQILVKTENGSSCCASSNKGNNKQEEVLKSISSITLSSPEVANKTLEVLKTVDDVIYAEKNHERNLQIRKISATSRSVSKKAFESIANIKDKRIWGYRHVDCEMAWGLIGQKRGKRGDKDIIIAVLDTGVDVEHPDLKNNIVKGYDMVEDKPIVSDINGHGTHCAGIIASAPTNINSMAGIANKCKIMPVRVMYGDQGFVSWIAKGIRWATDHGADIISMSFTSPVDSKVEQEAINYALEKGVILVAAAGNDGKNEKRWPAAYDGVISVASINQDNTRSKFSNYGKWVDLAAPGKDIYSTLPLSGYGYLDGTSAACPYVTGLIGLILSFSPSLNREDIKELITSEAVSIGNWVHYGLINTQIVLEALHRTSNQKSIIPGSIRKVEGARSINSKDIDGLSFFWKNRKKKLEVTSIRSKKGSYEAAIVTRFTLRDSKEIPESFALQFHLGTTGNMYAKFSLYNWKLKKYTPLRRSTFQLQECRVKKERLFSFSLQDKLGEFFSEKGVLKMKLSLESGKIGTLRRLVGKKNTSFTVTSEMARLVTY